MLCLFLVHNKIYYLCSLLQNVCSTDGFPYDDRKRVNPICSIYVIFYFQYNCHYLTFLFLFLHKLPSFSLKSKRITATYFPINWLLLRLCRFIDKQFRGQKDVFYSRHNYQLWRRIVAEVFCIKNVNFPWRTVLRLQRDISFLPCWLW